MSPSAWRRLAEQDEAAGRHEMAERCRRAAESAEFRMQWAKRSKIAALKAKRFNAVNMKIKGE